ncbi:MAG: type II toxin-antitoxin system YafQ family toxin [Candidatus Kuenenbacteria bacterium]
MYNLQYSKRFKKDIKRLKKDPSFRIKKLEYLLLLLAKDELLDKKYKNHRLKGEFQIRFECHIKPDLLLIYRIDQANKKVYLYRIGSHSELF